MEQEGNVQFSEDSKSSVMMGMIKQYSAKAKFVRLLAEENITINFDASAETASCEVQKNRRRINLPINVHLSNEDVFYQFSSHEVGHALWTSEENVKKAYDLKVFSCWNIIEDIRIERMVKEKWPGLVKNYIAAYKKLSEEGFFGDMKKWNLLRFEDRLNIYAKCGPIQGASIEFDEQEMQFYNECIKAKTEDEVMALAIRLYQFKNKRKSLKDLNISMTELAESLDVNIDRGREEDFDEEDEYVEDKLTEEEIQKLLDSMVESFDSQQQFESQMDSGSIKNSMVIAYDSYKKNGVTPYQSYLKHCLSFAKKNEYDIQNVRDMRKKFSRSVDIMTVQFEMKKAAWQQKNAKISKTGSLNLSRLHAYKTSEDIFCSAMEVPDAKNHGFIILLDASGSIHAEWHDMLQQTLLLTEFYKKIGAHFRVLLFGASYWFGKEENTQENRFVYDESPCQLHTYVRYENERILEVLSSDMSKKDYNYSISCLLTQTGFNFGGTPMMLAMNIIETYGNEFFEKCRVTKKKVVMITDGCPSDSRMRGYSGSIIVSDQKTKKNYFSSDRSGLFGMNPVNIIGKIYKDRYDIDFIPMMLCRGAAQLRRSYRDFTGKPSNDSIKLKDNFYQDESILGIKVFFIKADEVETDIDLKEAENGSIKDIQRQFKKALAGNRKSAVLMRVLADQLAM